MLNGICKLCKKESKLMRSHIIPKFMHKGIWEKKGKNDREAYLYTSNSPIAKSVNDGLKEYLLCNDCEECFSKYEKYTNDLLFDKINNMIPIHEEISKDRSIPRCRIFNGIDYEKLKMFTLSVFWRLAVSNVVKLDLGPHLNKLENILRTEKCPSSNLYPFAISKLLINGKYKNIIQPNSRYRVETNYIAREVYMGGYIFTLFVGNGKLATPFDKICIKENGIMTLLDREFYSSKLAKQLQQFLIKTGAPKKSKSQNTKL